jgi:hypothetical protein
MVESEKESVTLSSGSQTQEPISIDIKNKPEKHTQSLLNTALPVVEWSYSCCKEDVCTQFSVFLLVAR